MRIQNTLTLSLFGGFPERFLNLCMKHGIYVFDVALSSNRLRLCIRAKELKALRPLLKQTGMRMRIEKKEGLGFYWKKTPKKKAVCPRLCLLFLLFASLFLLCVVCFHHR